MECQKLLGHLVVKSNLSPLSGSVALRQLNPIQKNGLLFFIFFKWLLFFLKKNEMSLRNVTLFQVEKYKLVFG